MSGPDFKIKGQIGSLHSEKAFEYLFYAYYPPLCAYAYGIIRNQEDARDLVNDCFLELWKKKGSIQIESSFRSYLYASVRNSAVNYLRKKQVEQKYTSSLAYPFFLQEEITGQTERLIQMEEFEVRLKKSIDSLPQQCRYIFYLNRFEKMSYKDIAAQLNLSAGTVKTQIARALKKIRADFQKIKKEGQFFLSILVRHF